MPSNPILQALVNSILSQGSKNPAPGATPLPQPPPEGVKASYSQPSQSNPFGVTFSPQPVDLGRITVNPNTQAFAPQQQTSLPQGALPPTIPEENSGQPQGESAVMSFLRQMGIPIASTIAGMASPNLLPGAAGLSTGFNTGMQQAKENVIKEEELKIKKQPRFAHILDENGQLISTVPIGPKDITNMKRAGIDLSSFGIDTPKSRSTEDISSEVSEKYNSEQEKLISDNVEAYGKTREEVIQALKNKGKL